MLARALASLAHGQLLWALPRGRPGRPHCRNPPGVGPRLFGGHPRASPQLLLVSAQTIPMTCGRTRRRTRRRRRTGSPASSCLTSLPQANTVSDWGTAHGPCTPAPGAGTGVAPRWPHPDPRTGPCLAEEDYYEDDEEDDPDALKDPLYQIDLQVSPSSDAARRDGVPSLRTAARPQGGVLLPCRVVVGFAGLGPGASRACPCRDPRPSVPGLRRDSPGRGVMHVSPWARPEKVGSWPSGRHVRGRLGSRAGARG